MAKLKAEHLTLEIEYRERDSSNWVHYDVRFLFDDDHLFNTSLLRRDIDYWDDRRNEAFRANEYGEDILIHSLEAVLAGNKPISWQPTEPDISICFYPKQLFPFAPGWMGGKHGIKGLIENQDDVVSPDDYITVIAMVDTYNLRDPDTYTFTGPALVLIVTRKELAEFCDALREEYAAIPNHMEDE